MARKLTKAMFVKWGKMGGEITKKKGKRYFSKIGKIGAINRYKNI